MSVVIRGNGVVDVPRGIDKASCIEVESDSCPLPFSLSILPVPEVKLCNMASDSRRDNSSTRSRKTTMLRFDRLDRAPRAACSLYMRAMDLFAC